MAVKVLNHAHGDPSIWLCCDACGKTEQLIQHPWFSNAVTPLGWGKRKSKEKDHQLTGDYITEDLCSTCFETFQKEEYRRWLGPSKLDDSISPDGGWLSIKLEDELRALMQAEFKKFEDKMLQHLIDKGLGKVIYHSEDK